MEDFNVKQSVIIKNNITTEIKTIGNKLEGLVFKKNVNKKFMFDNVHYDIANIFIFQSTIGILSKLINNTEDRLYLDKYSVDISIISSLYEKYKSLGSGLKFEFLSLNRDQYFEYTGNSIAVETNAEEFIYIIATPLDHSAQSLNKYFVIFNLNYDFDIDNTMIDEIVFKNIYDNHKKGTIHKVVSDYRNPNQPAYGVVYEWEDIKKIMDERNLAGNPYDKVEFILGEIIEYKYILEFFRRNPQYGLDEIKYRRAYNQQDKRITILGKYFPEDILGREGYFDMGSLYP